MTDYPLLKFAFMFIATVALLILCIHPWGAALVLMFLSETKAMESIVRYWESLFFKK